jgi:hypothetical protein
MLTQTELTVYAEEMQRPEEGANQNLELWKRLRRRWADRPPDKRPSLADIFRAYEEATGSRIGCD